MNFNKMIKKQSFIISISIILMSIILIGSSYAIFFNISKSRNDQVVKSGTLIIDYSQGTGETNTGDNENKIDATTEDNVSGYGITVKNTGTLAMDYDILVYTGEDNELPAEYIKVKLDDDDPQFLNKLFKTSNTLDKSGNEARYILGSGSVTARYTSNSTKTHTVKVWIDYQKSEEETEGLNIDVRVKVEGVVSGSEEIIKNGYFYWTDNNTYASNEVPNEISKSYKSLITTDVDTTFIRTAIINNEATKHGVCMYYGNKLYCLDYGHWQSIVGSTDQSEENGNTVRKDMQFELEELYNPSDVSCQSTSSSVECTIGTATCNVSSNGGVSCDVTSSKHIVDDDGKTHKYNS